MLQIHDAMPSFSIGNVDGDGALEIVASEGLVYDGASYANEWILASGFGHAVAVQDVDGDRVGENCGGDTGFPAGVQRAQKGGSLEKPMWRSTKVRCWYKSTSTAILKKRRCCLAIQDACRCFELAKAASRKLSEVTLKGITGVYTLDAGDMDGDGEPELIWRGAYPLGIDVTDMSRCGPLKVAHGKPPAVSLKVLRRKTPAVSSGLESANCSDEVPVQDMKGVSDSVR